MAKRQSMTEKVLEALREEIGNADFVRLQRAWASQPRMRCEPCAVFSHTHHAEAGGTASVSQTPLALR